MLWGDSCWWTDWQQCKSYQEELTLLQNQLQWQEVSSDTKSFQISLVAREDQDLPNNYIVGVARQARRQDGVVVSSGFTWASCIYRKNTGKLA